tara:strand:- start:736 stop:5028 length:4293 start_codon:yes stop_codon:yes gene_type:complete
MIYITEQMTKESESQFALPQAGENVPAPLGTVAQTAARGGRVGSGTGYQDIQAGFVGAQTGQDVGVLQREQYAAFHDYGGLGETNAAIDFDRTLENKSLSQEEYETSDFYREDLKYIEGLNVWAADNRARTFDQSQERSKILSRNDDFLSKGTAFVGGMVGAIVDYKNIGLGVALTATTTAATAGLSAPISAFAGGATTVGRWLKAGINAYNGARVAAPIVTGAARTAVAGAVITAPQALTGLQNEDLFAEGYTLTDAAIDMAAGMVFDGAIHIAGSKIKQRYLQRNGSQEELRMLNELAQEQLSNGERIDVQPAVDAIIMRDPPEFSTVNFVEEAPTVVRSENGEFEAHFEGDTGLMAGQKAVGKTKAEAAENLKTKYMLEEIPQEVIRDTSPNVASKLRDLSIAKNTAGRRSFIEDAQELLDQEKNLSGDTTTPSRTYRAAKKEFDEADKALRLKPTSTKRLTEQANAKAKLARAERDYEAAIRKSEPNVAKNADARKARALSDIDKAVAEVQLEAQRQTTEDLRDFSARQTDPERAETIGTFADSSSYEQSVRDAQELRKVIGDDAALETRRLKARQELDAAVADPNYPQDQKAVITKQIKEIDAQRSLNEKLNALKHQITHTGSIDPKTIFPDNDVHRAVYEEILETAEIRQELSPVGNISEAMHDLVDQLAFSTSEEISIREVSLLNTMRAREDRTRNLLGFIESGATHDQALSRAVETGANSVIAERVSAVNSYSRALEINGLGDYFQKLSSSKNRDEALKVIQEIRNVENGGKKPVSGSEEAFKVAEIYKNMHDGHRFRGYQTGMRTRNVRDYMLRQVWNPDSLRRFSPEGPDRFVNEMLGRIDIERTFGKDASAGTVKRFLRKFYSDRVGGSTDAVELNSTDFFGMRGTDYKRMLDNREIHLKNDDSSLFVVENFGGGSVTWSILQSLTQSASTARMSEVFGVNPQNMLEHLKTKALEGADAKASQAIVNPSLRQNLLQGNPEHILQVAGVAYDNQASDVNTATWVSTIGNFVRGTLLQGVLLSSAPDLGTTAQARARLMNSVNKEVRKRIKVSTGGMSPKVKEAAIRSVSNATAFAVGNMQNFVAGGGAQAKLHNMSTSYANAVFKYGGSEAWTRFHKQNAFAFANSFYSNITDIPYKELDGYIKQGLLRAGVSASEWKQVRKGVAVMDGTGGNFIDLDALEATDRELSLKMRDVFKQFSDEAVPTPGAREIALTRQGTTRGTISGAMLSFSATLMGYPVSFMTKQMGRSASLGGAKGVGALATLSTTMLMWGALTQTAKDTLSGKTRELDDPHEQLNYFLGAARNGALGGLLGGMILDGATYGGAVSGVTGGVAPQLVDDIFSAGTKSVSKAIDGDFDKAAAELARGLRLYVPMSNLPYTKAAFDNLVYYPLLDTLDPDMLSRMESNYRKRTGGELRPSF